MDKQLAKTELPTLDAIALAFAAQRANGTFYNNDYHWDPETQNYISVYPNKQLMINHVAGIKLLDVTDQDRINAKDAREFLIDYHVMATLQEMKLSPWRHALTDEVKGDVTRVSKFNLLAYVPDQVAVLTAKRAQQEAMQILAYTSQHFGKVGERLEIAVIVLDKRFIDKFGCYFVFGRTIENNCVGFFTGNENCTVSGIYTGKVKRHNIDTYRNGVKVTEFNYIKPAQLG